MEFFSQKTNFDFMKYRWHFISVSLVLVALSVWAWVDRGENRYGVDFTGGSEIIIAFKDSSNIEELRLALDKSGYNNAIVQGFGNAPNEFAIRVKASLKEDISKAMQANLKEKLGGKEFQVLKNDYIGPLVGEEIRKDGAIALCLGILGILIYVTARFEFRFAAGAIVALIHDVTIAAGMFLLYGGEITSGVLAALLALIGYSVNDTIVVFDRIRENMTKALKTGSVAKKGRREMIAELSGIINASVNETLSRTIITNLTALISAAALWIFGGGALLDFAFTMTIGIIVGTYSSVFIASPVVLAFEKRTVNKGTERPAAAAA